MTEAHAGAGELAGVAARFRDLAGRRGIPEIVETAGDSLPGATTGHVVYDLGVALTLALGDLAEALDVADEVGGCGGGRA